MATNPSILIRIAANLSELRTNLAESKDVISTTTQAMHKLAQSLDGQKLEQHAHNIVAAIDKVGGASKLTDAEQQRLLRTLDAWIDKAALIGKTVPAAMLATAESLRPVAAAAQTVATSFDGIGGQITVTEGEMRKALGTTGGLAGAYQHFDGVLQAAGIHIGPQVKGLADIGAGAAASAASIGLLGAAGLVLATGFASWKITRTAMEFLELDQYVAGAWRQILTLGDVAAETAGAVQDTINRAIATGAAETISYTAAMQHNITEAHRHADATTNWNMVLAAAQREVRGLSAAQIEAIAIAQRAGATTEQLTVKFGVGALALKELAAQQQEAARAADAHEKRIQALDKAYATLNSEIANARGMAQFEEEAAAMKQRAEQEAFFAEQEVQVRLRRQQAAQDQAAAEQTAEGARIAANQAEIDAVLAAGAAHQQTGAVAQRASDQTIAGWAGIAQQVTITGEAVKEWINLMRFTAQANAILGDNSLFTTRSQRERLAALPSPRALGGPVDHGRSYVVGERGPELFVPSQSGSIVPNGAGAAGGITIAAGAFPITINGSVLSNRDELAAAIGDAVVHTMRGSGLQFAVGA